jgi:hypothetical protein
MFAVMSRERRSNDHNSAVGKNSMKHVHRLILIPLCVLSAGVGPLAAQTAPASPELLRARIDGRTQIETLSRRLLETDSATATIEKWCADHCMAAPAKIVARRVASPEKTPDAETRRRLRAESGEIIRYRHVQLVCGKHILSEADNWYVPSRLPAEANVMLETGDTPFGKAIRSLRPGRQTIASRNLWPPPPAKPGVNAPTAEPVDPPRYLLEYRALILTPDQTPVSEVNERYTRELLDFTGCDAPKNAAP